MAKSVAAIIVTFNRIDLLKENIKALNNQSISLSHIIIVNNNSSDGTTDYLTKYIGNSKYIVMNMNENMGGAGGFNQGLKLAINKTDDDYFWLMDDDTIPTEDSLKYLIEKASFLKDQFGYLCSNVRWKDGSPSNVPEISADWSKLIEYGLISVKIATFVSFFVNRSMVEEVGYPIADFFIWGDDVEYSLRLRRKQSCYMVIDSKIIHKSQSVTSKQSIITDDSNRLDRYFYSHRNFVYIGHKYQHKSFFRMFLGKMRLILQVLIKSNNLKLKRIFIILKAYFKGINFKPIVEKIKK